MSLLWDFPEGCPGHEHLFWCQCPSPRDFSVVSSQILLLARLVLLAAGSPAEPEQQLEGQVILSRGSASTTSANEVSAEGSGNCTSLSPKPEPESPGLCGLAGRVWPLCCL